MSYLIFLHLSQIFCYRLRKTFRRRPGRLLNILCTFNLRPVSTGMPLDLYALLNVIISLSRSSHRKCSVKKCPLKNFAKFTGKHVYQSLFKIKLQALFTENLRTTAFVWGSFWTHSPPLSLIWKTLLRFIEITWKFGFEFNAWVTLMLQPVEKLWSFNRKTFDNFARKLKIIKL